MESEWKKWLKMHELSYLSLDDFSSGKSDFSSGKSLLIQLQYIMYMSPLRSKLIEHAATPAWLLHDWGVTGDRRRMNPHRCDIRRMNGHHRHREWCVTGDSCKVRCHLWQRMRRHRWQIKNGASLATDDEWGVTGDRRRMRRHRWQRMRRHRWQTKNEMSPVTDGRMRCHQWQLQNEVSPVTDKE